MTIHEFGLSLNDNLTTLAEELKSGQYQPQSVKREWIPKPGSQEAGRWEFQRFETG